MNTPLLDIRACRLYNCVVCVQYTYASVQYIYLFITQLILQDTHNHSFWYGTFRFDCDRQTFLLLT